MTYYLLKNYVSSERSVSDFGISMPTLPTVPSWKSMLWTCTTHNSSYPTHEKHWFYSLE